MLAIGCLPELAFDARELTLQAHMSMHMSTLVSGDVADGQTCDQLCLVLVIA
jgi:hypothetical protein